MEGIKFCCALFAFVFITISNAQSVEIKGKVIVDDNEIEGIHVINKTSNTFTITKDNGVFTIPAKYRDTIIFSAIKYKPKEVVVTSEMINTKILNVYLTELITQLDEVVVGKVLTGNLLSDIKNTEVKRDINFYDLGIPGYTGKQLTISENKLNEAGVFKPEMLIGLLLGSVPLNPILNGLSGRTKMLKNQVRLERLNECLERIKADLASTFFKYNNLNESNRTEFFYYCLEDESFATICLLKNDIQTLDFLNSKLDEYKKNLQFEKD